MHYNPIINAQQFPNNDSHNIVYDNVGTSEKNIII
jgi:hypothetical protein